MASWATFPKLKIVKLILYRGECQHEWYFLVPSSTRVGQDSAVHLFFTHFIVRTSACLLQKVRSRISFRANFGQTCRSKLSVANLLSMCHQSHDRWKQMFCVCSVRINLKHLWGSLPHFKYISGSLVAADHSPFTSMGFARHSKPQRIIIYPS